MKRLLILLVVCMVAMFAMGHTCEEYQRQRHQERMAWDKQQHEQLEERKEREHEQSKWWCKNRDPNQRHGYIKCKED